MALPILRVLVEDGEIDPQRLAEEFAAAYQADPYRGHGYGIHQVLPRLAEDPGNWATYARSPFDGQGSLGNRSAMRVAPLGAWFHGDLDRVVEQAALSAGVPPDTPPRKAADILGDVDTTCAITAGVVAARTGLAAIPATWTELCEPLPAWITDPDGHRPDADMAGN